MKKISMCLFLICLGHLAIAMDTMNCGWETINNDLPDYNMLVDQPAPVSYSYPLYTADTVIKLEPLEEPHAFVPVLPTIPPAKVLQDVSSHNLHTPITIKKEDSIPEYNPPASSRKKRSRDYAWNNSSSQNPSRIPGRFKCPKPGCFKILRYSWGLTTHIKRVHGNLPRWGCPFFSDSENKCLTTFKTNSDYRKHLQVKHQTLHTEVQKRKLKKSDSLVSVNNPPTPINAFAMTLAHRPYTRSIARMLKLEPQ